MVVTRVLCTLASHGVPATVGRNTALIRLHDLRHGAASLALTAGVDVKVVSEMLGHSTTAITRDTYTAVFDEPKHAAAAAIAVAINGARPGARAPGASAGAA